MVNPGSIILLVLGIVNLKFQTQEMSISLCFWRILRRLFLFLLLSFLWGWTEVFFWGVWPPSVSPCPTLTLDPVHRHHPGYSVTSVGCPQELSLYKHYCLLSLCCTQTESWNLQHKLIIITMMRRRDEESSLRRSLVTRRIDRKPPISSCPPTSVTATTSCFYRVFVQRLVSIDS